MSLASSEARSSRGRCHRARFNRHSLMSRDREEELVAVAKRVKAETPNLDRVAVVFERPLPYLYIAREVFGGAGIPYQTTDALPLADAPALPLALP